MLAAVAKWPYGFPASRDDLKSSQRGSVSGVLQFQDRFVQKGSIPASNAQFGLAAAGEAESWQRESKKELIEPAIRGTLNVLKACSESKVKRLIVVSSMPAVLENPAWPKCQVKDEACWSDVEYCRKTKNYYYVSKTEAEQLALDYAEKNGLNVVTICPSVVLGPVLQSTMNASSLVLIKLLKGVECVDNRQRRIVDLRDLVEALLLLYEKPEAKGRYICTAHTIRVQEMVEKLKSMYPNYNYPKIELVALAVQ